MAAFISNKLRSYYKSLGYRVLRLGENARNEDKLVSKNLGIPNYGVIQISYLEIYQPVNRDNGCYVLRAVKPAKSRKRIVYKVVKVGTLQSARTINGFGCICVNYEVNKITHAPKGTRLFTFEKLEDAKHFQKEDEVIFECEVIDGIVGYGSYSIGSQQRFWEEFNKFNKSRHPNKAIQRLNNYLKPTKYKALLVTKLKLLREVE